MELLHIHLNSPGVARENETDNLSQKSSRGIREQSNLLPLLQLKTIKWDSQDFCLIKNGHTDFYEEVTNILAAQMLSKKKRQYTVVANSAIRDMDSRD